MSFQNLLLHSRVLKALEQIGYETPTLIQQKAIPKIVQGFDVRACAQTGTGKTAAFLLPLLSRLAEPSKKEGKGPRALILAPTRELALQIQQQVEKYSKAFSRMRCVCAIGGVAYRIQMRKLSRPYEILIATPGRLLDYLSEGKIKLSRVECLILDEADRMLDMGFEKPVRQIVESCPQTRQTLLFSATLKGPVLKLSEAFMTKPMEIVVHPEKKAHAHIEQALYFADSINHKNQMLFRLLDNSERGDVVIFTATKRHADHLAKELRDMEYQVAALHGDMSQSRRTRTLKKLKEGKVDVTVATDVAARGLDIDTITHVINFDLPQSPEDYVHRIGRTGRAGRSGFAISFVSKKDRGMLSRIEQYTGHSIAPSTLEGLEPKERAKSSPQKKGPPKNFKKRSKPGNFKPKRFDRFNKRKQIRGKKTFAKKAKK